jgi:hypothetical protein
MAERKSLPVYTPHSPTYKPTAEDIRLYEAEEEARKDRLAVQLKQRLYRLKQLKRLNRLLSN